MSKVNDPLIPSRSGVQPPSRLALGLADTIAISRILVGVGMIAAPGLVIEMLSLEVSPAAILLGRLIGGRDLVLGVLVWTAKKDNTTEAGRSEIKRALWAGVAADLVDVVSTIGAVSTGDFAPAYGTLFGSAAASFIGMAALVLKAF